MFKNKNIFNIEIINYFLIINIILISCFFSLFFIKKYETTMGYLTTVIMNEHCHYVFKTNNSFKNKKIYKLIINNFININLTEENYILKENEIFLKTIIICPDFFSSEPAMLIYGEETLLNYIIYMIIN